MDKYVFNQKVTNDVVPLFISASIDRKMIICIYFLNTRDDDKQAYKFYFAH